MNGNATMPAALADTMKQPACRHRVKSLFGPNNQLNVLFEHRADIGCKAFHFPITTRYFRLNQLEVAMDGNFPSFFDVQFS